MQPNDSIVPETKGRHLLRLAVFAAGVGLLVISGIEWWQLVVTHYFQYDYAFFYYAFAHVLSHDASFASLYNLDNQMLMLHHLHEPLNPHDQYVYPPQFAVLFSPLGLLPFRASATVWTLVSVLAYYGGIVSLIRALWGRVGRRWMVPLLLLASGFAPFVWDVGYDNINSVLFFLVVTGFTLHHQKKDRLAGAVIGLAIMMKVTPAAVLLIPILRRQWRLCLWSGLTVLAGTAVTLAVLGTGPVLQYALHFLSFGQTSMGNGPAPYNQSIVGVIGLLQLHGWLFGGKWLQDVAFLAFAMWTLYLVVVRVTRSRAPDWRLDMALASLCPLLFSPLDEQMHMLLALPALFVLWRQVVDTRHARPAFAHVRRGELRAAVAMSAALLSLAAVLGFSWVTKHWPMLAWLHAQMFVALIITLTAVLVLYPGANSSARVRPWNRSSDAPSL